MSISGQKCVRIAHMSVQGLDRSFSRQVIIGVRRCPKFVVGVATNTTTERPSTR